MLGAVKRAWTWFVTGLAEACAWLLDRLLPIDTYAIAVDREGGPVRDRQGREVGRLVTAAGTMRLEPPAIARRLKGAAIEVAIPAPWLFRRRLDPVAAQSLPYLDAFVRHQIDRITPWRVADVYYHVLHSPLPDDPARSSVEVGVVAKRVAEPVLSMLWQAGPARIGLVVQAGEGIVPFALPLGDRTADRQARLRPWISLGLASASCALLAAAGLVWWEGAAAEAAIGDLDQQIADQKTFLAAAARRDAPGEDGALRALQASRPRAVEVIDALSRALPDASYLTDLTIQNDKVRISGITTDASALVPALETSGRFSKVAAFAATTRLETGPGDRFGLDLQVRAMAPGDAAPP